MKKTFALATATLLLGATGCATVKQVATGEQKAVVQTVSPEVSATLRNAKPGQSVMLEGFNLSEIPKLLYDITPLESPQYLISDDPEYIRFPEAVAMRERVEPGKVRLYVYNVNGVREPEQMDRKINSTIRNLSETDPLTVRFQRIANPPASTNYYSIGKNGLKAFLSDTPTSKTIVVQPGSAASLDEQFENTVVKYDELVHGWYEFTIDQPAEISVIQTSPDEDTAAAALRDIEVLPTKGQSGAGRGKFLTNNFFVKNLDGQPIDTANGPVQLIVADGQDDPWIKGVDGPSGLEATLAGNYGVLYEIEIERKSSDGRGLALITWNIRGGAQWCDGMAMAMRVSRGVYDAGVYLIPSDQLVTRRAPEAVLVQLFPPLAPGETETINMTYSPPGASCLPTPLIFVPVDFFD